MPSNAPSPRFVARRVIAWTLNANPIGYATGAVR